MCAINPVHHKRLTIDVYTSERITPKEFEKRVFEAILEAEISLNEHTKLRWHVRDDSPVKCTCKFVAIGEPMNHKGCKVHKNKHYPCGRTNLHGNRCNCRGYRPATKPVVDDGEHWPLCICGHIAQEH